MQIRTKGFPDAIAAVYPKTVVQLWLVHMVHHSLNYVSWKLRNSEGEVAVQVYQVPAVDERLSRRVTNFYSAVMALRWAVMSFLESDRGMRRKAQCLAA